MGRKARESIGSLWGHLQSSSLWTSSVVDAGLSLLSLGVPLAYYYSSLQIWPRKGHIMLLWCPAPLGNNAWLGKSFQKEEARACTCPSNLLKQYFTDKPNSSIHLVLTFEIALRSHVTQMKIEVCAVPPYPAEAMGSAGEQLHAWQFDHGLWIPPPGLMLSSHQSVSSPCLPWEDGFTNSVAAGLLVILCF